MPEPEEMGDAVEEAILEIVWKQINAMKAELKQLERVAAALGGEWEEHDD